VTDYKIYWDNPVDIEGYVVLASTTTPSFSHTVTNLVAGHEYRFSMVAVNVVGDSDKSTSVGFIASGYPGVPGQPQKVSASDEPSISILWTAPTSNGGSTI
jgi:hypothetical protein